jgi:hypothetical protein
MNNFFISLFTPKFNKTMIIGFVLFVLGFLLLPVLIGIPLLIVGSAMLAVGSMTSVVRMFPGGDKIVSEYELLFRRMFAFIRSLIKETFK